MKISDHHRLGTSQEQPDWVSMKLDTVRKLYTVMNISLLSTHLFPPGVPRLLFTGFPNELD